MYGTNSLSEVLNSLLYLNEFLPNKHRVNYYRNELLKESNNVEYKLNEHKRRYTFNSDSVWNYIISNEELNNIIKKLKINSYDRLAYLADSYWNDLNIYRL